MRYECALKHAYPGFELDLAFAGGPGVTVLFGPSGAGKSTVLNAFAGLTRPVSGHIRVGGTSLFDSQTGTHLPPHRRKMGVVFQEGRLFPHLNVAQNLRFGQAASEHDPEAEAHLVGLLGITGVLAQRPGTLSGGERQRVAVARALLSRPRMLLMDEPLAALDGPRKDRILPYLDRLKAELELPILYVTHAVEEVARLADQVIVLDAGRIVAQGDVFEVLSDPVAMPYLGVREAGAVLAARVVEHCGDGLSVLDVSGARLELPGVAGEVGDQVRVRILAQDVILATRKPAGLSARNVVQARVRQISPGRGPGVAVTLQIGTATLLARITERSRAQLALDVGQTVYAIVKATSVARGAIAS